MYSFKQFLQEKIAAETAWIDKSYAIVFGGNVHIPITSKIDEIFGEVTATVFHATNAQNVVRVAGMQGSKKGLSVAGVFNPEYIASRRVIAGDKKGYGGRQTLDALIKLEGNVLVAGMADILSKPDEQGRRWINPSELVYRVNGDNNALFYDLIAKLEKMREDINLKLFAKWQARDPEKATNPHELQLIAHSKGPLGIAVKQDWVYWMQKDGGLGKLSPDIKKELGWAMKTYMDGCSTILSSMDKKFGKMLRQNIENTLTGAQYNELVANKLKIKEVLWLSQESYFIADTNRILTKVKAKHLKGYNADGEPDVGKITTFMKRK